MITRFPKGQSVQQVADFLMENYPVKEIARTAAQLLMRQTDKITVTRQQFVEHFRFIGERQDGTVETRGRKPKTE